MKLILQTALVAGLALAPVVAHAQTVTTPPSITVDLRDVPVRDALEQIFRAAKADYSIDPSISGYVNLKVTDIPFESALKLILRSSTVPLTYSVEGGVYLVRPRSTTPVAAPAPVSTSEVVTRPAVTYDKIEFTYADPVDFAGILNITMIPIFTRFGLDVPGATGIIKPGAPGTRNGNGAVVGGGNTPPAGNNGGGDKGGVAF